MRTFETREPIKDWSRTTLKKKLIKIGTKVVNHARCVAFQMAEGAIPRELFADVLRMIRKLRPSPLASAAWSVRASRVRAKPREKCSEIARNSAISRNRSSKE